MEQHALSACRAACSVWVVSIVRCSTNKTRRQTTRCTLPAAVPVCGVCHAAADGGGCSSGEHGWPGIRAQRHRLCRQCQCLTRRSSAPASKCSDAALRPLGGGCDTQRANMEAGGSRRKDLCAILEESTGHKGSPSDPAAHQQCPGKRSMGHCHDPAAHAALCVCAKSGEHKVRIITAA